MKWLVKNQNYFQNYYTLGLLDVNRIRKVANRKHKVAIDHCIF